MKHLLSENSFRARRGLRQRMALGENAEANSLAVLAAELEALRTRVAAALVLANLKPVELLTVQEIQLRVATVFKMHPNLMTAPTRCRQNISTGRMVAMALAREFTGLSLERIGQEFGGRDHGTVLYATARVQELCFVYPKIRESVEMLRVGLRRGLK